MSIQHVIDALSSALNSGRPMQDIMRENERAAGNRVVLPGQEPWLSASDWHPTVTVSVRGSMVRLVAILALRPGTGALTRTIKAIQEAGLTPCIVEPTRDMRETVKRWGWTMKRYGYGLDAEETWKPRRNATRR